jgi:hypothetical protein
LSDDHGDVGASGGRYAEERAAAQIRKFATGAVRSEDAVRDDPEGYLSPLAVQRFCQYMTKHRTQADGSIRTSDNWQLGMPIPSYFKGAWRHFLHAWSRHRGWPVADSRAAADLEEDLCALMFNVQGALHEIVKTRLVKANSSHA